MVCRCGCKQKLPKSSRKTNYLLNHDKRKPKLNSLCGCGCGKLIITTKVGLVFVHGHNWRGKSRGGMSLSEKSGSLVECACGCGELINEYRIKSDGRRYKVKMQKGHNRKGKNVKQFWKGGVTGDAKRFKQSVEYRRWRKAVFERDNYTCVECGARNGVGVGKTIELHPHHIKPFSLFPKLRTNLQNGMTLCVDCHKKTDTYGIKIFHSSRQHTIT